MIYLTIYTFCQFLSIVVITYDYLRRDAFKRGYEYLWDYHSVHIGTYFLSPHHHFLFIERIP